VGPTEGRILLPLLLPVLRESASSTIVMCRSRCSPAAPSYSVFWSRRERLYADVWWP
jgi:hypothetical protein